MTILGTRIALSIPKAINTQSQYVKRFFSTAALDARTRLHVTSHVHRLSISHTCTPLCFTSEFDSFPIKLYAFLAHLLVKILFRCLLSKLHLCQQMSVIGLRFRYRKGVWITFSSDINVVRLLFTWLGSWLLPTASPVGKFSLQFALAVGPCAPAQYIRPCTSKSSGSDTSRKEQSFGSV